ncbi:TlpA disulfide reductase family protein [Castellaniella sp. MT123]|uniref:TlpA family protein disulfide reductase n=1 Tax=Castellaniella sp. MT123 TaxID=3140381 RepID=UPI0031F476BC
MKLNRMLLVVAGLAVCRLAGAAGLQWYEAGDWATLRGQHASAPWVVHFWGMSCSPCRQELPAWSRFIRDHPDARVTFIEVEQADPSAVQAVLEKAGLAESDQRLSSDGFDVAERYAIDRRWHGETPMTLLISPDGQAQKVTGTMDFDRLTAWTGLDRP